MSFKERTAHFWHRVSGNKCQYEYYDERHGFVECNKISRHIHHIIPEGTDLANGNDSEHAVGMPLCEHHHVRNTGDEEWTYNFSFHPDAGHAYKEYREWKQQNLHMQEIAGKKDSKIPRQSPFLDMVDEHHKKRDAGERYHAGTDEIDQYYLDKMRQELWEYVRDHPEDKPPDTAPHPKYNPRKKRHWYDNFFDGKDDKKDQV